MSVNQKSDGRWNVVYRVNGKRHDKSFPRGEDGHKEALKFDAEMLKNEEARTNKNQKGVLGQFNVASQITFGELAREYIQHSRSNGSSDKYLKDIAYIITGRLFPFIDKDIPVWDIDYGRHILPLLSHLMQENNRSGQPLSKVTINSYGDLLSALFNYAVERDYITKNPMKLWKKIRIPKRIFDLTTDDFKRIWSFAPDHIRWAMEVCFSLGVRSGESELLSLEWGKVDFVKNKISVYGRKTKTYRDIPFRPEFKKRLIERMKIARTDHIIEFRGRPVKSIQKAFNTAVKKAGIPFRVIMYDLRHLFATTLADAGVPVTVLSKMLGHTRISTTVDVYCHTSQSDTRRAIENLPSLDDMTGTDE